MFNRVAVFTTAPVATFLALLFQLLLGLGIGKSKEQLDAVVVGQNRMELSDDTLSNFTTLKSGKVNMELLLTSMRLDTWQIQLLC